MKKGRGVKIGVIGLGTMGQHHARIASTLPGAKLASVADIDLPRAEEAGNKYGAKAFDDYRKLLPGVEAVCLSTPTATHFEIAQDCLNAGKHLLLEKPFTGASSTARTLITLAKEKGVVLQAGFIERFNPALQRLLKEVKGQKTIGLDIKRLSPFPERITDTDVIFDMMLHDLDLLSMLIAEEIESIKAKGEKVRTKLFDRVIATITYKNGIIARIESSRIFGEKTRKIVVTAEKFLVEADLLKKRTYIRDFTCPTPSALPVKESDQLTEELKAFVQTIRGKKPPAASGDDALRALTLAEEVTKACS